MKNDQLLLSNKNIEEKLEECNGQLHFLMMITEAINENATIDRLFDIYQEAVNKHYHPDQITFCVTEVGEIKIYSTHPGTSEEDYSLSFLHYSQKKKKPHYSNLGDVYIPVYHKEELIALAHLKNMHTRFKSGFNFLKTITNFVAIAIENKRLFRERIEQESYKTQLTLARQIQTSLMPHHFSDTRELEFDTLYIPHNEISGDYFDFFHIENSNISIFCIADVAGKGIPAALLMANLQANLRRLSINYTDLKSLLIGLNEAVYENTQGERLVTIFLAAYDVVKNELTYINAGHHYPILMTHDRPYRFLKQGTTPIGIVPDLPEIQMGKEIISEETIILAYTDGLEEIRSHKEKTIGPAHIISLVDQLPFGNIGHIADKIEDFIENFKENEPIGDDITVLLCKIKPDGITKGYKGSEASKSIVKRTPVGSDFDSHG